MAGSYDKTPVKTVPFVEPGKYAGLWYEIAHLPARFMKDCECTTAQYGLTEKKYLTVKNRCLKSDTGKWNSISGKAFIVPDTGNSVLKVQFFWPIKGDYRIIALDKDYRFAMVGNKTRKYLWILSRTPKLEKKIYKKLVNEAAGQGFPVENLIVTKQDCKER